MKKLNTMSKIIGRELRAHAPFTAVGALSGIAIMAIIISARASHSLSAILFWSLHPFHVVLSALVNGLKKYARNHWARVMCQLFQNAVILGLE